MGNGPGGSCFQRFGSMNRLPVTTIGGYLGAGKTTLINHMLRNADGTKLAVLVNEFGALPIDEDLIEARDDNLISIAGGCICCSFGDNLVGTLMELSKRKPRPDHILIEASGVAIPESIAATISLVADYQINGVIVLADVETVRSLAADKYVGDTIERQLSGADLVLVTKVDLVAQSRVDEVSQWIAHQAPHANVVPIRQGVVPNAIVLGQSTDTTGLVVHPHSDADYESIVIKPGVIADAKTFAETLADPPHGIIRAKGFVKDSAGKSYTIQVVGRRVEVTASSESHPNAVVCIGRRRELAATQLHAFAKGGFVN